MLGRQPAIGLAELESLYGAEAVRPIGDVAAVVDAAVDFARLGSTIKAATLIDRLDSTNPQKAFDRCRRALPDFVSDFPDGKIKLGTSLYGLAMPLAKQNANTLSLKKVLRDAGRSVRVVPNTEPALSSAQTYHNQLTSELGCELVFVCDGDHTLVGRVTDVQNINEYTERDRDRPKRDTRVGMLPPKLAQTIINLASGLTPANNSQPSSAEDSAFPAERGKTKDQLAPSESEADEGARSIGPSVLLDPFCGTGVILQEASLMGYDIYGTDIEERMIRYTRDNINWLRENHQLANEMFFEVGDATTHTWRRPIDIVACEGYLGTPFASEPPEAALKDSIMTCNLIMKKSLQNIHSQIEDGTRLCIAAPAWFVRGKVHHLPFISHIDELGYTHLAFTHAKAADLVYHREDQVVGRELLVLQK